MKTNIKDLILTAFISASSGCSALYNIENGVFGTGELLTPRPLPLEEWKRYRRKQSIPRKGLNRMWINMRRIQKTYSPQTNYEKMKAVNDYFNQNYQSQIDKNDYWKSPKEFLETGGGDCEDFALIKYAYLQAFGIPESHMRLVYLLHENNNQLAHMVLLVQIGDEHYILDNRHNQISKAKDYPEKNDYVPIYSFNEDNLWRHDI